MKKLTTLSIFLVLLSAFAFAQVAEGISIGAEGEFALSPLIITQELDEGTVKDEGGQYVHFGASDDADGSWITVYVKGENPEGTLGFAVDITSNALGIATGPTLADFVKFHYVDALIGAYVKPFGSDILRIDVGGFNGDVLRGKIGDTYWDYFTVVSGGKDDIFTRFKSRGGALFSSTIGGLYIGILAGDEGLPAGIANFITPPFGAPVYAEDAFQEVQGAVGYTIENVGLVRAQYVGHKAVLDLSDPTKSGYSRAEIAFAYTGLPGLTVDLGGKVPFAVKGWNAGTSEDVYQAPFSASLGALFEAGDFAITGRVDGKFGSSYTQVDASDETTTMNYPLTVNIHLEPTYALSAIDENLVLGADVGVEIIGKTSFKASSGTVPDPMGGGLQLGFGLWAQKNVSNGFIRAGVAYHAQTVIDAQGDGAADDVYSQGFFSIPIALGFEF
jgi:hypothetical protein